MDQDFIRRMQAKVEEEMRNKEREVVTYWLAEVDKLIRRRHKDLASLSNDLQELRNRMDRRLKAI